MAYLGCFAIDDYLAFYCNTHTPATGAITDADAVPPYRIYEDEADTPILTGNMAKLDDANTVGFYSEQIQLTAGNGFEEDKSYCIRILPTVGGVSYALERTFQIGAFANQVWDEVLTGATHNISTSAGRRLRQLGAASIASGTAEAGGAATITLEAGEVSTADHIYNQNLIAITGGTGVGQVRMIVEYTGSTRVVTVDMAWEIQPDTDSEYQIIAFSGVLLAQHGQAVAATASTITLSATALIDNDSYVGSVVFITTGVGAGQARLITAYVGGTKVASVSPDWEITPDATSIYKVLPVGRAIVESFGTDALTDIWTYATRTLTMTAAEAVAAISGSTLTILRGDTYELSLTDLGNISTRDKLWFTVKTSRSDHDHAALILIEETLELVYSNGGAPEAAGNGTITVTDQVAGDITIKIDEIETKKLSPQNNIYYDVQWRSAADDVHTLTSGTCHITADVTRRVDE